MANLFNQNFNKEDILKRVGSIRQIMGAQKMIYDNGKGKGTEVIYVRNGKGLEFVVVPDRGLDILNASFKSIPLAWISKNGLVANSHYDDSGLGWLRNFGGGLLTTCGLTFAGATCIDQQKELGLHGRYSNTPAENVCINEYWDKDEFVIQINALVRESNIFGENIVLYRSITTGTKDNSINIKDKIVNEGFRREPLMIIYHMNYGFPLVGKETEILIDPIKTTFSNSDANPGQSWKDLSDPIHDFNEIVYYHQLKPSNDNTSCYELKNKKLGIGVQTSWNHSVLKNLVQWKMTGEGDYVLGLEPSNCYTLGRDKERQAGSLQYLESWEEKTIDLKIHINEY